MALNLDEICRVCLKNNAVINIFDSNPYQMSTKISALASIEILSSDGLPHKICLECGSNLNRAWSFREICCSSNEMLLQYKNDNGLKIGKETDTTDTTYDSHIISDNLTVDSEFENKLTDFTAHCTETITNVIEDVITESLSVDEKVHKIRKKHTAPKRLPCLLCGKTCQNKASLVRHTRTHQGKHEFECEICHKGFTRSGHLTMHMRTHTGEKPYACSDCPKTFYLSSNLKDHMRLHTGERPFLCPFCAKSFSRSSNLAVHVKIHTGEKSFLCSLCGQAFITKGVLQQHMTIHTGVKAFQCSVCHKKFSQPAHLTRHMKTHR